MYHAFHWLAKKIITKNMARHCTDFLTDQKPEAFFWGGGGRGISALYVYHLLHWLAKKWLGKNTQGESPHRFWRRPMTWDFVWPQTWKANIFVISLCTSCHSKKSDELLCLNSIFLLIITLLFYKNFTFSLWESQNKPKNSQKSIDMVIYTSQDQVPYKYSFLCSLQELPDEIFLSVFFSKAMGL